MIRSVLHDPEIYNNPEEFSPERFLNDGVNAPDPDPNPAFGYGRRICPGRHFSDSELFITIASVLAVFIISPPTDESSDPIDIDHHNGLLSCVSMPLSSFLGRNEFQISTSIELHDHTTFSGSGGSHFGDSVIHIITRPNSCPRDGELLVNMFHIAAQTSTCRILRHSTPCKYFHSLKLNSHFAPESLESYPTSSYPRLHCLVDMLDRLDDYFSQPGIARGLRSSLSF